MLVSSSTQPRASRSAEKVCFWFGNRQVQAEDSSPAGSSGSGSGSSGTVEEFLSLCSYVRGDYSGDEGYQGLSQRLSAWEEKAALRRQCGGIKPRVGRLMYLALPPSTYPEVRWFEWYSRCLAVMSSICFFVFCFFVCVLYHCIFVFSCFCVFCVFVWCCHLFRSR